MGATKTMRPAGHRWREGLIEMLDFLTAHPLAEMGRVVEIGTYLGESTAMLAEYFEEVVTVDPWDLEFMRSVSTNPELTMLDIKREFEKNTAGWGNVTHYRMPSLLASRIVRDQTVDMVYIDGWHRVIPCVVDILAWLPKIRPGGWLGGHDYTTSDYSEVIPATMYTIGRPDRTFQDDSWLKHIA